MQKYFVFSRDNLFAKIEPTKRNLEHFSCPPFLVFSLVDLIQRKVLFKYLIVVVSSCQGHGASEVQQVGPS